MEQPRGRVPWGAQCLRFWLGLLVALLGQTGVLAHPLRESSANMGAVSTIELPPRSPSVDDFAPEPPPAGEPSPIEVRYQYQGSWEYRWGDSPVQRDGMLSWAKPDSTEAGWTPMPHFHNLPDRHGQKFLWMRTRLYGPPLSDPVLYIFVVDQIFEAYLDGRLIYRFGEFTGPHKLRFSGYKTHLLRVGSQYAGQLLTLRIYSDHTNIGVSGVPRLGERGDIITDLFKEDLSRLLIGAVLFLIGALVLVFFVLARQDRAYFMYGAFALSAGAYFLMQLQVRSLLMDRPLLWIHVEVASLYCLSFFLCGYIEQVFGRGPLSLVRRLWQLQGAFIIGAAVAVGFGKVALLQTLPLFQFLIFVDCLVLPATVLRAAWNHSAEARIFLAGFAPAAAISIYDILAAVGLLPRTQLTMSHIGNAAFVLAMGAILSRRFFLLQRRLRDYSAVLQLSLASTQALAPEQRSQVALDELLRLLGATRALLFLFNEENRALVFSLGRDRDGNRIDNPQGTSYSLIRRAVARRRPVILQPGQRVAEVAAGPGEVMEPSSVTPGPAVVRRGISVMAAPLLARDQLLGVVYLESDADRRGFRHDDMAILTGLASHLAIAIVSSRAVRLEVEAAVTRQRFDEQSTLLDAAVRMAAGDLSTPILAPPGSAATHLAQALDAMRRDIFSKVQMLQTRSAEIQSLNEELRRQIEQRSRRLMSAILRQQGGRAAPLKPLEVGQVLVGRYRVIRTLGQGAMGVVYEVERTTDHTRLAAKLLSTRADQTAVVRFTREAQILARLSHPNLIAIRDVDMTAGGMLFIVLELVIGSALNGLRARYGDFPWALAVLRQIADGLSAIHEAGVVHRDLKPANVLIAQANESGSPLVKLADFGVSLLLSDNSDPLLSQGGHGATRPPASSAMAVVRAVESEDAVAALLQSSDGELPALPSSEADEPCATMSLSPGALLAATVSSPLVPAAAALPMVRTASAHDVTSHPNTAASSAHNESLLSAIEQDSRPADSERLTLDGMLVGTPMYMAPELWNIGSQQAGPASDIFSFGVIAFELLTGSLPFTSAPVLARWHGEHVAIARIRAIRPDVPIELAELVDSCLTEDPIHRPAARVILTRLGDLAAASFRAKGKLV